MVDALVNIAHAGHGAIQVQPALVLRHRRQAGSFDPQFAEGLVGFDAGGNAHHRLARQLYGFLVQAGEQQTADLWQGAQGGGIGAAILGREAIPQGVLVELQTLVGGPAEDHGPQTTVADGQGGIPVLGGLAVPQGQGRGRRLRQARDGAAVLPFGGDLGALAGGDGVRGHEADGEEQESDVTDHGVLGWRRRSRRRRTAAGSSRRQVTDTFC